jgi:Protein of unknown function (DUF2950)
MQAVSRVRSSTYRFLAAWAKPHKVVPEGEGKAMIEVGTDGWLPIPIVKTVGGWRFDVEAGTEEMRVRRIGRNESAAIKVVLAIFDAEREYATHDWNHDGLLATRRSWRARPARKTGFTGARRTAKQRVPSARSWQRRRPRARGWPQRLLRLSLPHSDRSGQPRPGRCLRLPGEGPHDCGFAILAGPVKYGDTGVMTFMVSHDGVVYQKNLGANTVQRARAIHRFDPDPSWTVVDQPS